MTKTLADMTAEERDECVGMWTDATHCALQGIILGVFLDHARVLIPENAAEYSDEEEYIWVLNHVTPRFDLPRAWTPDGEPVDGSWEKSTAELPTKDYKATFTQHYRRWVGEWEQDNE